ncbi:MAG: Nramp family divalent metal transporter [Hyphomicrobiales bacterium]
MTDRDILGGWRRSGGDVSLPGAHQTIAVNPLWPSWRKMLAFLGPGYLVAVGYMDPGNWATALAGGSKFGYMLLSVALLSSLMAIILQSLSARLAVGSRRDLAQACRDAYPKPVAALLWVMAEIAIIATDLAEVIGTAIGLQLLFGLPLAWGIVITSLDVFVILMLQRLGFRAIEAFIVAVLLVIAVCFAAQIILAKPELAGILGGFAPSADIVTNPEMLYLALGILGATVMPHNLYLHSSIVQTRNLGDTDTARRQSLTFATIDSTIALVFALVINASILILAAAAFHANSRTDITELGDAHSLLDPLLGSSLAPILFAVALIGCGLNSTVTATLAGQIVMEGFLEIRLPPWMRRLITRLIAIVPAALTALWFGEAGTAQLLIFSQVVLSLQLPFAVIPLVIFTSQRSKMGPLRAPLWITLLASLIALVIVVLNTKLVIDFFLAG